MRTSMLGISALLSEYLILHTDCFIALEIWYACPFFGFPTCPLRGLDMEYIRPREETLR